MDDLIKKLAEAKEGSRELDAEICLSQIGYYGTPKAFTEIIYEGRSRDGWRNGPAGTWEDELPHYTTSIDCALTLVPEGEFWSVGPDYDHEGGYTGQWEANVASWVTGNSPALALCIAALQARSHMGAG